MVVIKVKGDADLGNRICHALAGNRGYVENDIIINYDSEPGNIFIILGHEGTHDITLEMERGIVLSCLHQNNNYSYI